MKTLLCLACSAVLTLILTGQRIAAWFVTYAYEIELSDKKKVMEVIDDPLELESMQSAYKLVLREAEEANARYNALLPVGKRHVLHVPA